MLDFTHALTVPNTVLHRELDAGTILLNLATESYLSLDEVGTRMWALLIAEPSIEAAFQKLLAEYDVEPDVLRRDVENLLGQLLEHGLAELKRA